MSWRRWKVGAGVACLTGFFTGIIGLAVGTPWKGALLLLAASIGKDFILWQKDHPVEKVTFETEPSVPSFTNQNPS